VARAANAPEGGQRLKRDHDYKWFPDLAAKIGTGCQIPAIYLQGRGPFELLSPSKNITAKRREASGLPCKAA